MQHIVEHALKSPSYEVQIERDIMKRSAFTLIELLVVIGIVGVLFGLLLPAVQSARESARRSQCANNLKQIGLALLNFHDSRRHFPAGYTASAIYTDGATDTTSGYGWAVYILPFIEEESLYRSFNFRLPLEDASNGNAIQARIAGYLCPSDRTLDDAFIVPDASGNQVAIAAPSSYAACVGGEESATTDKTGLGIFFRNSHTRMAEITDGTSKTLLIGERAWANAKGVWAGAINNGVCLIGDRNPCPPTGVTFCPAATLILARSQMNNAREDDDGGIDEFSSMHTAGSNFVMADGSVHFIRSVTSEDPSGAPTPEGLVFHALGTKANAEPIPADWLD